MSEVNVLVGDMFSKPSDLIVVPCSTALTVTTGIANKLEQFKIPAPSRRMSLGDIEVVPAQNVEHLASQIAFAATVEANSGTYDAVRKVVSQIAKHCNTNEWISTVAAPLLGTGAGGLQPGQVLHEMSSTFLDRCSTAAQLNIYSLDKISEDSLGLLRKGSHYVKSGVVRGDSRRTPHYNVIVEEDENFDIPRVFISYSHSNEVHSKWVQHLATRLRKAGVDARLDKFHLRLGEDLAHWMNRELALANKVIAICDATYCSKFEGRVGGVAWEATMMMGDMYQNQTARRHIAVQLMKDANACVPSFLSGKYNLVALDYDLDDNKFNELLEFLFEVEPEAPAIGTPPTMILQHLKKKRVHQP